MFLIFQVLVFVAKTRLRVVVWKYVLISLNWRKLESVFVCIAFFIDRFLQPFLSLCVLVAFVCYSLHDIAVDLMFYWKPLQRLSSCCLLGSLLGPEDLKLLLTFTGPFDFISQKIESFIATVPGFSGSGFWVNEQTKSVAWVRERTIPTERLPLVGEVSGNFSSSHRGGSRTAVFSIF
jgi:hypothetical protein